MKKGFTCGAFDVLHPGHVLMFEEAKTVCDYLIVAVQSDPTINRPEKNKPVQPLSDRVTMVQAIRFVDEVVTYNTEEELLALLVRIKPDIRIIGADWKGRPFTGHELPIEIYFNSRDHGYSSTALKDRVVKNHGKH